MTGLLQRGDGGLAIVNVFRIALAIKFHDAAFRRLLSVSQ